MLDSFILLGHDAPLGRYPAEVVPVGLKQSKLVAVYRGQLEPLSHDTEFVRHSPFTQAQLVDFDFTQHRLFAFKPSQVARFRDDSEQTFFRRLLHASWLETSDPFFVMPYLRASRDPYAIASGIVRCAVHLRDLPLVARLEWLRRQIDATPVTREALALLLGNSVDVETAARLLLRYASAQDGPWPRLLAGATPERAPADYRSIATDRALGIAPSPSTVESPGGYLQWVRGSRMSRAATRVVDLLRRGRSVAVVGEEGTEGAALLRFALEERIRTIEPEPEPIQWHRWNISPLEAHDGNGFWKGSIVMEPLRGMLIIDRFDEMLPTDQLRFLDAARDVLVRWRAPIVQLAVTLASPARVTWHAWLGFRQSTSFVPPLRGRTLEEFKLIVGWELKQLAASPDDLDQVAWRLLRKRQWKHNRVELREVLRSFTSLWSRHRFMGARSGEIMALALTDFDG